jgi:hypothetical protein
MKTHHLINKLSLSPEEGWSYLPFASGNNSSFYTHVIENVNITIAWIAVTKNISAYNLKKHHLKREKNDMIGISNSLPRLIIVTDGRKWFLSTMGAECFIPVKFSTVLINLFNELKTISSLSGTYKPSKILQNKLNSSMNCLKKQLSNYGERIQEIKKDNITHLFTDKEDFQKDIKNDIMHYFKLSTKEGQLDRYTKTLHELLFRTVNNKQLQFLLKFPNNDIYVNPFYKKSQLFICITRHYFKDELGAIRHKPIFLLIDEYGSYKSIQPSEMELDKEIMPNLLKINTIMVSEFLSKEPF